LVILLDFVLKTVILLTRYLFPSAIPHGVISMIFSPVAYRSSTIAGALLVFLAMAFQPLVADSKPRVTCEVDVVARHPSLVTFTWRVTVESERDSDACDLIISFLDGSGTEVHALREILSVKAGRSTFSGHDVCDSIIWDRIKKYVTTFDCVI
jgi:hypothetical protein